MNYHLLHSIIDGYGEKRQIVMLLYNPLPGQTLTFPEKKATRRPPLREELTHGLLISPGYADAVTAGRQRQIFKSEENSYIAAISAPTLHLVEFK